MNNTGKKFGGQNLNSSYIWYMNKLGEGFKNSIARINQGKA